MSLYAEFIESVKSGCLYKIDLSKKSLSVNGKIWIKNGNYNVDKILFDIQKMPKDLSPEDVIEYLYKEYKYSVPSERVDKRTKYFSACSLDEIPIEHLVNGTDREISLAYLEGFILFASLANVLKWNHDENHWFWKSSHDHKLVILKEWL